MKNNIQISADSRTLYLKNTLEGIINLPQKERDLLIADLVGLSLVQKQQTELEKEIRFLFQTYLINVFGKEGESNLQQVAKTLSLGQ